MIPPLSLSQLPRLLGRSDPTIIEVGCNDGEHTWQFVAACPQATVYAFEPDARARERFLSSHDLPTVTLFDIALSDQDGEIEFYPSAGYPTNDWRQIPGGWDKSGSIRMPKHHLQMFPWCEFRQPVTVKTQRLDTWATEHSIGTVDLLWADVQGAEEDLIRGGHETLKRTRYFYTEYADMELYEGQINLRQMCALLPTFAPIAIYQGGNVLFKNKEI